MREPAYEHRRVVTYQETNALGNVYFAHYLRWQGECRELFLSERVPEVLAELGEEHTLVTTRCSCEYFAELFALDEVVVRLRLGEADGNHVTLLFEYWTTRDGREVLAARGEQQLAWLRRVADGFAPRPVPAALIRTIRDYRAGLLARESADA